VTLRLRHPLLFVVALIASCILWFFQSRDRVSVRSLRAPVTLVDIPTTLHPVSAMPDEVTVQLRGPLSQAIDPPPEVRLDLTDAEPGLRFYTINDEDIRIPRNMSVVSVQPREIELELERIEIVSLPVQPVIEGSPAPGFIVGAIRVFPPQMRVRGPDSRLAELSQVETFPILIEGATGAIESTVQVRLPSPLRSLRVGPVQVLIDIVPAPTPTPTPTPIPRGHRR
jgi:YbbR domain-containing protein